MAKILFGAQVVDMKGKLGGQVYSKNKGGAYVRNKVTPVNRRSPAQQLVRSAFGGYSAGWRSLSAAQRDEWDQVTVNYPRKDQFGNVKYLSGQQLFVSFNSNIAKVSNATSLMAAPQPPEGAGFVFLDEPTLNIAGATTVILDIGSMVPSNGNVYYYIRATPGLSAGVSNANSYFKAIGYGNTYGAAAGVNVTTQYIAVFGAVPPTGAKVFVEITPINAQTGESGAPFIMSAVAV